jgi:hypothetical protein
MMDCSKFHCSQTMSSNRAPLHTLPDTETDEAYSIYLEDCDSSASVSTLSCSYSTEFCSGQLMVPVSLKRTHNAMNLASFDDNDSDNDLYLQSEKRTRGANYSTTEIRSLLVLMERILPKCPDEWEIIRMVHGKIFPDHSRTVSSLQRKFRDLCAWRSHKSNSFGRREIEKAKEVEWLISQKDPGFQLVLNKKKLCRTKDNLPKCSIPHFNVKVPNPLDPTSNNNYEPVPKVIQVPESPTGTVGNQYPDEDEMSELDVYEYEAEKQHGMDSVIIHQEEPVPVPNPIIQNLTIPYTTSDICDPKLPPVPAVIIDHHK